MRRALSFAKLTAASRMITCPDACSITRLTSALPTLRPRNSGLTKTPHHALVGGLDPLIDGKACHADEPFAGIGAEDGVRSR